MEAVRVVVVVFVGTIEPEAREDQEACSDEGEW